MRQISLVEMLVLITEKNGTKLRNFLTQVSQVFKHKLNEFFLFGSFFIVCDYLSKNVIFVKFLKSFADFKSYF